MSAVTALDVIEQLEALSRAELQHEIGVQRDRVAMMERVYAILTWNKVAKKPARKPRKTTLPDASVLPLDAAPQQSLDADRLAFEQGFGTAQPADTTDLERLGVVEHVRRRLVDLLKTLGPLSWSQLVSQSRTHMKVLGPALREAQVKGQVEKKSDGLYYAVGK